MRLAAKLTIMFLLISVLASCQKILGTDYNDPSAPPSDRTWTYASFDYIEIDLTVRSTQTDNPIPGVEVKAWYEDSTGHIIHWSRSFDGRESTIGATGTTNSNGRVTLRMTNARLQNTTYRTGGQRHQQIKADKTIRIRLEQSGYKTVNTSRTRPVNKVTTDPYPDGSGNKIRHYSVETSINLSMSPD